MTEEWRGLRNILGILQSSPIVPPGEAWMFDVDKIDGSYKLAGYIYNIGKERENRNMNETRETREANEDIATAVRVLNERLELLQARNNAQAATIHERDIRNVLTEETVRSVIGQRDKANEQIAKLDADNAKYMRQFVEMRGEIDGLRVRIESQSATIIGHEHGAKTARERDEIQRRSIRILRKHIDKFTNDHGMDMVPRTLAEMGEREAYSGEEIREPLGAEIKAESAKTPYGESIAKAHERIKTEPIPVVEPPSPTRIELLDYASRMRIAADACVLAMARMRDLIYEGKLVKLVNEGNGQQTTSPKRDDPRGLGDKGLR